MTTKIIKVNTLGVSDSNGGLDYINIDNIIRIEHLWDFNGFDNGCRIWYSHCYSDRCTKNNYYDSELSADEVAILLWGYEGVINEKEKTSNGIPT